jgi:hypothetical protein
MNIRSIGHFKAINNYIKKLFMNDSTSMEKTGDDTTIKYNFTFFANS